MTGFGISNVEPACSATRQFHTKFWSFLPFACSSYLSTLMYQMPPVIK